MAMGILYRKTATMPCSEAFRYHIATSALFCGTPSPFRYIFPRVDWASAVLSDYESFMLKKGGTIEIYEVKA